MDQSFGLLALRSVPTANLCVCDLQSLLQMLSTTSCAPFFSVPGRLLINRFLA